MCRVSSQSTTERRRIAMWIGFAEFDFLLGDVASLKQKRAVVRPVIADLQKRFGVSVAEVGSLDLHRRAAIGVGVVAADQAHVVEVLDAVERRAVDHREAELLSVRRRVFSADDF